MGGLLVDHSSRGASDHYKRGRTLPQPVHTGTTVSEAETPLSDGKRASKRAQRGNGRTPNAPDGGNSSVRGSLPTVAADPADGKLHDELRAAFFASVTSP